MTAAKHVLVLFLLSLVIIIFPMPFAYLVHGISSFHNGILFLLGKIFTAGTIGILLQKIIAALLVPFIVSGVIAFVYWLIKRQMLPCFMEVAWVIWFFLMAGLLIR